MRWLVVLLLLAAPAQAWETLATPLPYAVDDAAVVVSHGIHIIGGAVEGAPTDGILRLDPETGVAREYAKLPEPTTGLRATFAERGALLYGGTNATGEPGWVLFYDPLEATATPAARLPDNRTDVAPVWVGNHSLVFGGEPCLVCTVVVHHQFGTFELNTTLPWPVRGAAAFWDGSQATILGGIRDVPHDRVVRYDPVHDTMERLDVRLPVPGRAQAVYDGANAYILIDGYDHVVRYNPVTLAMEELQPAISRDTHGAGLAVLDGRLWIIGADGDRVMILNLEDAYVDHDNPWCARLDVAPCPPVRSSIPLLEIMIGAALPVLVAALWWQKPALEPTPRAKWYVIASASLCGSAVALPWANASLGSATTQAGLGYVAGGWWGAPVAGLLAMGAVTAAHWSIRKPERQSVALVAAGIGIAWGIAAFSLGWGLQGTNWVWTWGALLPLLGAVILLSGLGAQARKK